MVDAGEGASDSAAANSRSSPTWSTPASSSHATSMSSAARASAAAELIAAAIAELDVLASLVDASELACRPATKLGRARRRRG